MAHEIEVVDGVAKMFYAGEVPWHGLGVRVESELTADAAIAAAGLDWEVSKEKVYVLNHAGPNEGMQAVANANAIKRMDNNEVLSIMSDSYHPVQNKGKFDFFDAVVGTGEAKYHTAMSLNGGRKIALLAKLPKTIKVKGDSPIEEYVLLADSFDGSVAFTMMLTPTRVVCANTLNIALTEGAKTAFKLRHSKNIHSKVQDAQKALGFAVKQYEDFEAAANNLVDTAFSDAMMKKVTEKLFPAKDGEVSPQSVAAREAVFGLFENGKGHEGIRGTAWAAINAVAEFADHDKQTRITNGRSEAEARGLSLLFGQAARMKQAAVDYVYQLAA